MIAIQSENGELVKVLKNVMEGEYGFHRSFGIISKEQAGKRIVTRKRQYYDYTHDDWLCSFKIQKADKLLNISALSDCEAIASGAGWNLKTPIGVFNISEALGAQISPLLQEGNTAGNKWLSYIIPLTIILFLIFPIMYYTQKKPVTLAVVEEILEPITVKIEKVVHTVKIEQTFNPNLTPTLTGKAAVSRRAVQRDLGFLGMVGSKEITNAIGGVPQHLKVATAGAGPGGTGGSGGEVLTGLGKGLRRTTVGNTGVQGLGGIGTKGGAGGGLGGYGNTLVASGEGKGISAIAVSNNDMVLEGGLSRYVINATIAKYLSQVRRCYEAELKNHPELQGLVEMSFEINPTGRLNFSKVNKSTLSSPPVESCISAKMMDWQFPQPKGGVNVSVKYPFMLRPVGV
ncbi:MAG: AgmX/PglI C-terminal domain-containing protein [Bacteriovorax sp.]|nr:AgmX/PglI C-terminal domain-containing protein [Bacteriovorax sp.]